MRIVHDVEYPMQVGASSNPYLDKKDLRLIGHSNKEPYHFRIEFVAVTEPGRGPESYEVIHLEGNAKHIRQMLQDMLSIIEANNEILLEDARKGKQS